MALQTKTWTIGDLAWGSWSNAYELELVLTEESVSQVDNTSQVAYILQIRAGSQNRFWCDVKSTLALAGQTVENTENIYLDYNTTRVLLSGTVTVAHDDDGSLALPVEAAIYPNLSNTYAPPNMTISQTWPLTAIPRQSTLTATAANIEEVSTLVVQRHSDSFTHSIAVAFGSIRGWLTEGGALTGSAVRFSKEVVNFTLPESFYAQIPDDPSGVCTLTLTTYSGDTQIGTAQTASFTVTAARSRCDPTATLTVTDGNETTAALTGDPAVLVRFCSNARCVLTAAAKNGASPASATVAGQAVALEDGVGVLDIPGIGLDAIPFTVTDSRGYSYSGKVTPAVIPYVKLTNNATAARLGPTENEAVLSLKGSVFTGAFGAAGNTLTCRCRVQTDGVWGDWQTAQVTAADGSYTGEVTLTGLSYQKSYRVETQVTDAVSTAAKILTVHEGVPVFDWGQSDFAFHVPVAFDRSVSGLYLRSVRVWGSSQFRLQTKYGSFNGTGDNRQTVFLFGSANGKLIGGIIGVNSAGGCYWSGTEGVSASAETDSGIITVTLPNGAYDILGLISAEFIKEATL